MGLFFQSQSRFYGVGAFHKSLSFMDKPIIAWTKLFVKPPQTEASASASARRDCNSRLVHGCNAARTSGLRQRP